MRTMMILAVIAFSACGGNSTPTTPTTVAVTPPPPPPVPACQTNRTGTVILRNNGSRTVDMLWNGSVRGTVNPGQTLPEFTVPASGPQYVFESIITNTNIRPCAVLIATPIQCQSNSYGTCSGF